MSGEEEKKPTVANLYAKQKEWGNDISRERNKGLFKRILKEGSVSDKPVDGSKVEVHYVGRLLDGTVFDSSRERETTFEFVLGNKSVIKGWEEGVKTMNRGEVCLLTCKPEYAYGEKGSPPKIPANATLQFEVELIQWKGEDITPNKDGGVRRLLLKQDTKPDYYMPKEGAEVKVHVQGKYKENVFEDRDVTFVLGEGSENNVVEALEIAIMQMRKGQCYHLDVLPRYAYGDKGNADFGIPPGAELEYQVELHQFEKMKEPWDYENVKERIAEADHVKERGTMFFKESKFDLALKVYKRAFGIVEGSHIHREEDKEACKGTVAVLRLNMALCHLKLENGLEAREECEKVLEVDNDNIKALFRKGQAYVVMQEYEAAAKAFEDCVRKDPKNKAARTQLAQAREKLKAFKVSEKKRYVKMFEKLSEELNKGRDYEQEKAEELERERERERERQAQETSSDDEDSVKEDEKEKEEVLENKDDEDKTENDQTGHVPESTTPPPQTTEGETPTQGTTEAMDDS